MSAKIKELLAGARAAAGRGDWATVENMADQIIKIDPEHADGYFLLGLKARASGDFETAVDGFEQALRCDKNRYDIAVELAGHFSKLRRNGDARALLDTYVPMLDNSPRYLDLAGTIYVEIGLPALALPLYRKAHALQPKVDIFQANLANCAVYNGNFDEARPLFEGLLKNNPNHRGNHYHYSRLVKATDERHVHDMLDLLKDRSIGEARNVPLYFALGKEYEDLKQWDQSFQYYAKGCAAIERQIQYQPTSDLAMIEALMETCTADWLSAAQEGGNALEQTPVFIAGLPRTGTTLVERILSSHSHVSSLGETHFIPQHLKRLSGEQGPGPVSADAVRPLADMNMSQLAEAYMQSVAYRLEDTPMFIDKLPLNFLYLGFIAKAVPNARFVYVKRHPMDACFSMFKQVFIGNYRYSYSLDHLGAYYIAHEQLVAHWQNVLGDRFVVIGYEDMVGDQDAQTRQLLARLDLPFEDACLDFANNSRPSTTASAVQVRSKIHSGAIGKWRNYASHLEPLRTHLSENGIDVE